MNKIIMEMGNKFACITRSDTGYQAESVFLTGGRHFLMTSDTPKKAVQLLAKAVKHLKPL